MNATTAPRFRYVGTTDDTTTCERCGKIELRSVVVVQPLDAEGNPEGDVNYYGTTCAARALAVPGGARAVRDAAWGARWKAHLAGQDARRMLAAYGLPEAGEATAEQFRAARRAYIRNNYDVAGLCAARNTTVTELVAAMMARHQAALATAALLKIDVDAPVGY